MDTASWLFFIVALDFGYVVCGILNETKSFLEEESVLSIFQFREQDLCPGRDVCLSDRSSLADPRKTDNLASCCTDCSCDANCNLNFDCCFPDALSRVSEHDEEQECISSFPAKRSYYPSFYMVTTCNKTINCSDLARYPWGHLLPVYSPSRHQIYINDKCAICNGASDGTSWETTFFTMTAWSSDIDLLHANIQSSFSVYFRYKHDDLYNVAKKRCYMSVLDTCSPSYFNRSDRIYLSWLNDIPLDSHTIDLLCNSSFQSNFISKFVSKIALYYKSVLCYICSDTFSIINHDTCMMLSSEDELRKGPFVEFNFAMLIDWGRFANSHRAPYNKACEVLPNGTTNYHNCRDILCPVGKVLDADGRCYYPAKEWVTTNNFKLFVKLNIDVSIVLPANIIIDQFEKGIDVFLDDIQFYTNTNVSEIPVQVSQSFVNIEKTNGIGRVNFFALYLDVGVAKVDPAKLMPQIHEFLQMKCTARHDGKTFTFRQNLMDVDFYKAEIIKSLSSEKDLIIPKFILNLKVVHTHNIYKTMNAIPISKTFFCHLIELGQDEVEFQYDNEVVYVKKWSAYFSDLEYVRSKREDGTYAVKVCMDNLPFRKLPSSNGTNCGKFENLTCLLALVVFTVLKRVD